MALNTTTAAFAGHPPPPTPYFDRINMVCPMCITAAVIANAPGIAAAVGGFAAAKVALDQGGKRSPVMPDKRPVLEDKPVIRPVIARKELPKPIVSNMSYEEW